jgi:GNAT superfamily N-acetyltransferase
MAPKGSRRRALRHQPGRESCEFAIVVADDWQGKGLARRLMGVIIDTASSRGLRYMHGDFLSENTRMLAFVASLGFVLSRTRKIRGSSAACWC